jgi:hypothetical protein
MYVSYHEKQSELQPLREWFTFKPDDFALEPGGSQVVSISLTLPLDTKPDQYFAYLEASPHMTVDGGSTSVGIAAASKLYFNVKPSNFLSGVVYRIVSLWNYYQPWTNRLAIFFGTLTALLIAKRFFRLSININKRSEPPSV